MATSLMCGPCAIAAAVSLEDRVQLALSRSHLGVCVCPDCGKTHSWKLVDSAAEVVELDEQPEQLDMFAAEPSWRFAIRAQPGGGPGAQRLRRGGRMDGAERVAPVR